MEYEVLILRRAQKQLSNVPKSNYARIRDLIASLASNPRPVGSKKLTGRDVWRLRSGNYRVIYEIDDRERRVVVLDVGDRKDVYA
ncbi:MAG: type II toxin-antitoxin system RelE/ParE family toxin [Acidobacteriota bacterium]|nr:type II toxin-antitoxin system RelE/ParE family toxin [Acidobacteriota bacterium]